jgi:hypothetical protein
VGNSLLPEAGKCQEVVGWETFFWTQFLATTEMAQAQTAIPHFAANDAIAAQLGLLPVPEAR